jgi:hypothetical protein
MGAHVVAHWGDVMANVEIRDGSWGDKVAHCSILMGEMWSHNVEIKWLTEEML